MTEPQQSPSVQPIFPSLERLISLRPALKHQENIPPRAQSAAPPRAQSAVPPRAQSIVATAPQDQPTQPTIRGQLPRDIRLDNEPGSPFQFI